MARDPIPTWFFALVVVRLGRRFLLVRESAQHGHTWYLPGGRLNVGESLVDGAGRETLEESGVPVDLEGVLRVEHNPSPSGHTRCRIIFLGRPRDDTPPKSVADAHSVEAGWYTLEEMKQLKLRGVEVMQICEHVLRGGAVYPLRIIGNEGGAWE